MIQLLRVYAHRAVRIMAYGIMYVMYMLHVTTIELMCVHIHMSINSASLFEMIAVIGGEWQRSEKANKQRQDLTIDYWRVGRGFREKGCYVVCRIVEQVVQV